MAWTLTPQATVRSPASASISWSARRTRSRERLFTIEFLDPGVEAYAFTFG